MSKNFGRKSHCDSPEVCRPLLFDLSTYDLPIDTEFALLDKRTKKNRFFPLEPRCLKTTEKVSFNIVSEGSYVYILSGQKLIKNAKNGPFWRVFEKLKLAVKQCYQTGQI